MLKNWIKVNYVKKKYIEIEISLYKIYMHMYVL